MPILILIFIILALTVISFYYGFKKPPRTGGAWKTRTAVLAGIFLCAFVGYALMDETGAERELAEYIKPYPNLKRAVWGPPTQANSGEYWLFSTRDSTDRVLGFYDKQENIGEWRISSSGPISRVLRRDDLRMEILVTKKGESTEVIYRITSSKGK